MKRALSKHILTLFALILGTFGWAAASVKGDHLARPKAETGIQINFCLATAPENQPSFNYSIFKSYRDERIVTEENDDNNPLKLSLSRKPTSTSTSLAIFSGQKTRFFSPASQKQLSHYQFLINGSSRYLTFQVLRI